MYGVHIGHTFSNSLFFSGWLVYTYIRNILIMNYINQYISENLDF